MAAALILSIVAVAVFNVFLYARNAASLPGTNSNHAIIYELSEGAYRGVIGSVDYENPDLYSGAFTNNTLWAADLDTCAPNSAWVEVGWSKRADWAPNYARHKFQYQLSPGCVWQIGRTDLGSPAVGPFYEYRLVYNSGNNRWQLYINGTYKAQIQTNWASADYLAVGGEVSPKHTVVEMGPTHSQLLQYRRVNGTWVAFNYEDDAWCDIDPPLQPYNLIHPVGSPDWIYVWGPAAGGYCP